MQRPVARSSQARHSVGPNEDDTHINRQFGDATQAAQALPRELVTGQLASLSRFALRQLLDAALLREFDLTR